MFHLNLDVLIQLVFLSLPLLRHSESIFFLENHNGSIGDTKSIADKSSFRLRFDLGIAEGVW